MRSAGRLGMGLLLIAATVSATTAAGAHEVRPGYLEIREQTDDSYQVLWKVPARGDQRLGMYVRLPETCQRSESVAWFAGGAHLERWRERCPGGLAGTRIVIQGLEGLRTDVIARVVGGEGGVQTARLTPARPWFEVKASAGFVDVAATYFALGVEHILLGVDHLLFVLALLLLVGDTRRLVTTITAFTIAHSLTLAAAVLGFVRVPPLPVEAAIALSIVFVAVEVAREGPKDLARRRPWVVAFSFGLLHGLGFAGALSEVGIPEDAVPAALAFFNLGVEAGQLAFVAAVLALFAGFARLTSQGGTAFSIAGRVARPTAYAIGVMAAYWLIERTTAFLGA